MNVKWDKRFLDLARLVASWSKDPSTRVGAVIADQKNRIVSLGFNGFARGVEDLPERLGDREVKYKIVLHAEENALLFANRDVEGCTIYTWPLMPCASCMSRIIQKGIRRVVSVENENPRWQEHFRLSRELAGEAGVEVVLFAETELSE
ncbi:MAG: dCMP deaminase family protein [Alphaproteobacteria bacterium]|nr:dCMP deaminase family protein [Alphaproteobacteria bacterium]